MAKAKAIAIAMARPLALGFMSALLSSCYVTTQGARYLSILSSARPAETLLADPGADPAAKSLMERSASIRKFATGELGLKDTKSFRSFAEVEGRTLTHVVQACAELSFTRHEWYYPFVGRLPYRGYFSRAEADAEAARLMASGLDVIVRPSDAFSSLGFLADPLFSFMADYDEFELADLMIHEMTHATVFIRGGRAGNFNEELATFVGRQGAIAWMELSYGKDSQEVSRARIAAANSAALAGYLRETARLLGSVYGSTASDEVKRREKARIIAERAELYLQDSKHLLTPRPDGKPAREAAFPMAKVDNATLDLFRLYEGEPEKYRGFYEGECGSDLRVFIERLKAAKDPSGLFR